jgi:hypothetical protein
MLVGVPVVAVGEEALICLNFSVPITCLEETRVWKYEHSSEDISSYRFMLLKPCRSLTA